MSAPADLKDPMAPLRGLGRGRRTAPGASLRQLWLFAASAPLGLAAIEHAFVDPVAMLIDLAALGTFWGGHWMLGEGLKGSHPRLPLRTGAALVTGLGAAIALSARLTPATALLYGGVAAALHLVAFGIDPLHRRATVSHDRTASHLDQARALGAEIDATLRALRDAELTAAGQAFLGSLRRLIAAIQHRPEALPRARPYLGIYLRGARDALRGLADVWESPQRRAARDDVLAFLADLDSAYAAQAEAVEQALHQDMTVEMDVVRDRLKAHMPDKTKRDSED